MDRLTFKKEFQNPSEEVNCACIDMHTYNRVVNEKEEHYYLAGEVIDKLADYEDKEEQGLLIELPCKVGDTVYFISREEIIPVLVDGFGINENGLFICGTNEEHFGYSRLTPPAKNLYLTRSEAEEALAKMGGK